jgi:Zn-dependent metalloprotease
MMKTKVGFAMAGAMLACGLLLTSAGADAHVLTWPTPQVASSATADASPEEVALLFLEEHEELLAARSAADLDWIKTARVGSLAYVRFQQVHDGIPIEGAQVVVTVDGRGMVRQVSDGSVPPGLIQEPGPCLSPAEAEAAALSSKPDLLSLGVRGPVYVAAPSGEGARFVRAVTAKRADPFGMWEAYVDCASGDVVGVLNLVLRADGKVYDPNPVVNPTLLTVTLPNLTSATNLMGTLAQAWACTNSTCDTVTQRAVADGDGNFLYDPVEPSLTDPFSEVNAYYHVDKVNAWFETNLDYIPTGYGCSHRYTDVAVNMDYENGFFGDIDRDGCGDIALGQDMNPGGVDFAYDGEVIYHEFTHGVIIDTSDIWGITVDSLGHDYSADGLSEGTADYYAFTITDSPILGEYALGTYGQSRTAINGMTCPDSTMGEGHHDGQMWSGTLWDIREVIGNVKTDHLVLAVLNSLSRHTNWSEAGDALVTQARALEGSILDTGDATTVENAVAARLLIGCVRINSLLDGESGVCFAEGPGAYGGWVDAFTCGLQFSAEAPAGARRVVFRLTAATLDYSDPDYDVYANTDAPVGYTANRMEAIPTAYSQVVSGSPTVVAWTDFSDPPIVPGTTYYISIYNRSGYGLIVNVEADIVEGPVVEPTDDDGADAVEDTVDDDTGPADLLEVEDTPPDEAGPDPTAEDDAVSDAPQDPAGEEDEDHGGGKDGCGCSVVR